MDTEFYQDTVVNIFNLLGVDAMFKDGRLLSRVRFTGAYAYIGAGKNTVYSTSPEKTEIIENEQYGVFLKLGCGVQFSPNFGKKKIAFVISLDEGADEFDFHVIKIGHKKNILMKEIKGMPLENIQWIIESTYDELIQSECGGFISI